MAARKKTAGPVPMPSRPDEDVSINVRKIENGYVVRHSSSDSKGNYHSKETFHAQRPVMVAPVVKPAVKPAKSSTPKVVRRRP